jgi:hypothetical protein
MYEVFQYKYREYGTDGKQQLPIVCSKWKRQTSVYFLQMENEFCLLWSANNKWQSTFAV